MFAALSKNCKKMGIKHLDFTESCQKLEPSEIILQKTAHFNSNTCTSIQTHAHDFEFFSIEKPLKEISLTISLFGKIVCLRISYKIGIYLTIDLVFLNQSLNPI